MRDLTDARAIIERYVDPGYRFSGLGSVARYLLQKHAENRSKSNEGR